MIQKLLNEVILAEDKKKREEVTGKGITGWRSSGLGTCMRGRFLDRLLSGIGIKPEYDARTLRVFEMGNQVEEWLMNSLEKQTDWNVYQQVEMYDPEYNLSGHLDGFLKKEDTKEEYIVECKSKNSKAFWYMDKKGEGAQVHHKMQLHSYLYMLNKYGGKLQNGAIVAPRGGRLQQGCILYVSKDDMAMLEYPVRLNDPELEKMWKFEIQTLNDCWTDHKAPPAPEKGSWQEKYCKFCEVGICAKLDDKMVEELFEENPEKVEVVKEELPTWEEKLESRLADDLELKVGDRVIAEGLPRSELWIQGRVGTVKVTSSKGYGVIFDDSKDKGHSLDGHTDNRDGWWCLSCQLKRYSTVTD